MSTTNDESTFRVAAFQGPIDERDPQASLARTIDALKWAHERDAHVLCMPETYLQGYFRERRDAWENSIDLESSEFADICSRVGEYSPTLLLGLNERRGEDLYNTVVAIEGGKLIGRYSKNYVCFDYFRPGLEFPVFERAGVKYGIIICWDSSFVEPARIEAMRGAQVIFSPHFNRMEHDKVDHHYRRVRRHHVARAIENGCWMVRSNVICRNDGQRVGLGDSFIVNEVGEFVCEGGILTETMLFHAIPKDRLNRGPSHWKKAPSGLRDAFVAQYQALELSEGVGG